jgi:hypothetical protein
VIARGRCRGRNPGGPISSASRSGRWDMEDGRWGLVGPRYPISDLRSSVAEAALADRVREVGG